MTDEGPVGNAGGGDDATWLPDTECVLPVEGLSSGTVDFRFALISSSASSAISINLRLRKELVEDDVEPEAVCKEQAAESVVSRSSFDVVMGKTVS